MVEYNADENVAVWKDRYVPIVVNVRTSSLVLRCHPIRCTPLAVPDPAVAVVRSSITSCLQHPQMPRVPTYERQAFSRWHHSAHGPAQRLAMHCRNCNYP